MSEQYRIGYTKHNSSKTSQPFYKPIVYESKLAQIIKRAKIPRYCCVCGTEIDVHTPHYVELSTGVDRIHLWCAMRGEAWVPISQRVSHD